MEGFGQSNNGVAGGLAVVGSKRNVALAIVEQRRAGDTVRDQLVDPGSGLSAFFCPIKRRRLPYLPRSSWTLRGPRELQDALNDRTADAEPANNDVGGLRPRQTDKRPRMPVLPDSIAPYI